MLLKVLIVDDDIVTRTSLSTMLDWEKQGFALAGGAVNGEHAIRMIENNLPDIVITDMSMPIMDGIVLIEYLERKYSNIRIIALSGYDDFDYVRQSMKKGAVDYLLKHKLTPGLLLAALDAARQQIRHKQEEQADRHHTKEQLASAKEILTQEFILQLVTGEIKETEKITRGLRRLDINLDTKNLVVVAVEIDDYSLLADAYPVNERNKLLRTFLEIARGMLNEYGKSVIAAVSEGAFVILFSFGDINSGAYIHNHVTSALERIKTGIWKYLNITASFGISNPCGHIPELSGFYMEAQKALKERFYEGKNRLLRQSTAERNNQSNYTLDLQDEKNLTLLIKSFEKQAIHAYVENLFREIQNEKVDYNAVRMIAAELFNIATRIAREAGINISVLSGDIPFKMLQKYDTASDIKILILNIYDRLVDLLKASIPQKAYSEITKKAVAYIHANYSKSFSLNDVAEHAGVNSSYLSHIFKGETGKGFVEYINSVRIEKARTLIENGNMGLKAIVKELGFSGYNYFFKVFKEFVGMTPLEYEESCRKQI